MKHALHFVEGRMLMVAAHGAVNVLPNWTFRITFIRFLQSLVNLPKNRKIAYQEISDIFW